MNLSNCSLPIIGFSAYSGTGKTTLIEALLPRLVDTGVRVAVIKHAHHDFDVDKPGKDSYRLRKAGASQMLISSRYRNALMTETPDDEATLKQLIQKIDQDQVDLILVEGFKNESFPKIELNRTETNKPFRFPADDNIVAVACDSLPETSLPILDINNIDNVLAFVLKQIESHQAQTATCDSLSPTMLSVDRGREKILASLEFPTQTHVVDLDALTNHVLASPVIAPVNVPSSTNSAMDGYAIRSDDLDAGTYTKIAEVFAGQGYKYPLQKGQCVRIMTGAPVPENADTVIMREQACDVEGLVTFDTSKGKIRAGQNVRQAGEDLRKGSQVFPAGTRVSAPVLGMIASLGLNKAEVYPNVTVALFSTGDEVQAPGTPPKQNCIYDTNRFSLKGLLQKLGCEIIDLGIIEDSKTALADALKQAMASADVIISSGGVSVGDADYIKSVLTELGDINFWRVNMRPGRPLAFGKLGDTPFFGLPGNPVAVMVTYLQFVEPAIRKLQGEENWQPQRIVAITQEKIRSRMGRTEYTRGSYNINANGQLEVRSTGSQGSGILRSMHEANCLIEVSPEVECAEIGDRVTIIPLASRV
ncbi:bifunctional molybdopterin-guanine dinucleotide biosynthesis adaptor protein MobB/molybdopterin molybdotransferase MoeA [Enterovibrio sp. ZSDZ35]|uniref:Molybdopterin molybdenumtransferase n=1 Tax=Enterovibrio qingdaonensis TaxID=2899818 RepID=A0ABT5QPX9_9GAMM|nr:bifunctional molybdopterin-guanine dinucleotide biosynthesis adaptor protein MobB/molybdopterin molybdotransferase MoeA [Enterovibrio sp. ZSDZ35]MDD1783035.1 bifunctional molybdopterin-guanine dinucleotide biosynthesis adaptor protein MobB/molybdopterin molybdotransferase MoeA [Enterovibrio sp. ZSDZ35]